MLKGRELAVEDDEQSPPRHRRACSSSPSRSTTTRRSRSRPSTSSSPTRRTARSTTCGGRCSSTSTPHLIGLTATPNKQTFGFFNQNLVMEYGHEQAVADGVNVNYDVYRIRTEVTEAGSHRRSRLLAGSARQAHPRPPRLAARRRLRVRARRARPQRADARPDPHHRPHAARPLAERPLSAAQELPKTLVFAKDDNHAEAIVASFARSSAAATSSRRRSPTAAPATSRRT
jgi:type I restriction enzyme R subunit